MRGEDDDLDEVRRGETDAETNRDAGLVARERKGEAVDRDG